MSSVSSNQVAGQCPSPTQAHLLLRLRHTYGLSNEKIDGLDDLGVIRTVATLDFLSNNLPASSQALRLGDMLL